MEAELLGLLRDMLATTGRVSAPVLLVALTIGVFIGLFQTVFQVQEATLTFVPKLLGIGVVLAVSGSWMLDELSELLTRSIESIPVFLGALRVDGLPAVPWGRS